MNNKEITVTEQEVQAVLSKIKTIIAEYLSCSDDELVLDAKWHDDLMADSLDLAYILRDVEILFGINIDDSYGWTVNSTVGETCANIAQALKECGLSAKE